MKTNTEIHHGPSQLFTVRLFREDLGDRVEYRGQATHVISGAVTNFRTWEDLEAFLVRRLEEATRRPDERAG